MKDQEYEQWAEKAKDFIKNLQATEQPLNLTQLCNDFLADRINAIYFNLIISWTWHKSINIDYGNLPQHSHWAIWSASEPFTWLELTESEKAQGEYNDIERYKELVRLAMKDPKACWKSMGIEETDLE